MAQGKLASTSPIERTFALTRKRMIFILVAVSVGLYINTLNCGFVLDDLAVIKENAYVKGGIKNVPLLSVTPYLKGFRINNDATTTNDLYRPLSLMSFAVEYQLWGDAPSGYHLLNVLLYAGCVLLLFRFLALLLGDYLVNVAFITALLFALHPVHTEVVANIKGRDELYCFFFAFSSLLFYGRYHGAGRSLYLAGGTLCLLLSLLAKETAVSMIAVIPLVFFGYKAAGRGRSWHIVLSAAAILAAYFCLRWWVLTNHQAGTVSAPGILDNALSGAPNVTSRVFTALMLLGYYIRLLVIPYPLVSDYGLATFSYAGPGNVWAWLSILVYVGAGCWAVLRLVRKGRNPYAFAVLFYLITIAIFSNIFMLIGATLAERFLFFPSVGFCLLIALLLRRMVPLDGPYHIAARQLWVLVPVAAVFSYLTIQRNSEWQSNETLFTADVQRSPRDARLLQSLGSEYANTVAGDETDPQARQQDIKAGIGYIEQSLAVYPANAGAYKTLGDIFAKVGAVDSAEACYLHAIALDPSNPIAISALGGIYFGKQDYRRSADLCLRSLQLKPGDLVITLNLSMGYLQMHIPDSARYYAQKVLQGNPDDKTAQAVVAAATRQLSTPDTTTHH
jgi:protein O-mannosyl-transferase